MMTQVPFFKLCVFHCFIVLFSTINKYSRRFQFFFHAVKGGVAYFFYYSNNRVFMDIFRRLYYRQRLCVLFRVNFWIPSKIPQQHFLIIAKINFSMQYVQNSYFTFSESCLGGGRGGHHTGDFWVFHVNSNSFVTTYYHSLNHVYLSRLCVYLKSSRRRPGGHMHFR